MKCYVNSTTGETTHDKATALGWYAHGARVEVWRNETMIISWDY